MTSDWNPSFIESHPFLSDPFFYLVFGLVSLFIILYVIFLPIQNEQIEIVKNMDCITLHDKFLNNDLYMLSNTYLEQEYIMRCLK